MAATSATWREIALRFQTPGRQWEPPCIAGRWLRPGVRNLEVGGGGGAGESWLDMKGQGGIEGSALLEATCNVHPVTV